MEVISGEGKEGNQDIAQVSAWNSSGKGCRLS